MIFIILCMHLLPETTGAIQDIFLSTCIYNIGLWIYCDIYYCLWWFIGRTTPFTRSCDKQSTCIRYISPSFDIVFLTTDIKSLWQEYHYYTQIFAVEVSLFNTRVHSDKSYLILIISNCQLCPLAYANDCLILINLLSLKYFDFCFIHEHVDININLRANSIHLVKIHIESLSLHVSFMQMEHNWQCVN